jgi:localization factor PodJL
MSATALEDPAKSPIRAEVESLLAAVRRSTNAGNSAQPRETAFSWVDPAAKAQATGATRTRLALLGGIGLLVLAAIGTGLYLSNNFSQTPTTLQIAPKPTHHAAIVASEKWQPALAQPRAIASPTSTPRLVAIAPATATRMLRGAAQTKPLTSLERLAALAGTGNVKAQEVLGLAYLDGDGVSVNEAEGAKWLERAAASGEPVAAYRLGTLYERGHGVAADHAKATQWYAVAAKAGNRKAMHNLAVAYAQGSGVQKDLPLAAQWFLRAASLGLPDSQFDLAVLYERGLGVPQSLSEAYKWYAIAAAQGDAESKTRMDAIASQISARDKLTAEKSAAAFHPAPLERAANSPPIAASLIGG